MVERPLAAAHAAEVEPQGRKAAMHECIVQLVNDRMVHRSAELRVRMKNDGDRCVLLPCRVITPLDAPGGAGEYDLRHSSNLGRMCPVTASRFPVVRTQLSDQH